MGYDVMFVSGEEPQYMHNKMAETMDKAVEKIKLRKFVANNNVNAEIKLPLIILRSPKGWTGPKVIDGKIILNCLEI